MSTLVGSCLNFIVFSFLLGEIIAQGEIVKHIIVTTNDPASLCAMDSYEGTHLVHDDSEALL